MDSNNNKLPKKYSILPPIGASKSILANVNKNSFEAKIKSEDGVKCAVFGPENNLIEAEQNFNNSNKKSTPESPQKAGTNTPLHTPERRLHTGARAEKFRKRAFGKISRISPLVRFRTAVHTVIRKKIRPSEQKQSTKDDSTKAYLSFDKNYYRANQARTVLTRKEKRILNKEPFERTEEDLFTLKGVVGRLKAFEKYTPKVKHDLARVVFYMTLNKGRYIIKQGHDGFSFYFIITGKVQVRITEICKDTGDKNEFAVAEMGEGAAFGELALMHNIKRTATIVCIEDGSEFLRVERHDFETVLQNAILKEWNERLSVLKSLTCLNGLSEEDYNTLNTDCRLVEFMPGEIIIGNTNTIQNTFSFIAHGLCEMVRQVQIVKEQQAFGKMKVHLQEDLPDYIKNMLPKVDIRNRRYGAHKFIKPEKQLWSIGMIGNGYYFGFGEDMSNTFIMAKTKVEVLQIRRIKFVKQGRWRLLEPLKIDLNKAFPSNKQLLRKYISESKWDYYKQKLVMSVVKNRKIDVCTDWNDVPMSIKDNTIRCGSLQECFYTHFINHNSTR